MMRLLISVRSSAEALLAARGGADFIDLKEPGQGALGGLAVGLRGSLVGAPPAAIDCLSASSLRCTSRITTPRIVRWRLTVLFNLETAVGRARVSCGAVGWQGATTLRAHAREEEQRR